MKFSKYQALGNAYLAVPGHQALDPKVIERLCNRHYGVGSDGVLVGPIQSSRADFRLRIFNPDASEAEKSGNGLRIFCRYMWDNGLVTKNPFTIETAGGLVRAEVLDAGRVIRINMGAVSFLSEDIPVVGAQREVIMEDIQLAGASFKFCAATIGNPHCVIPVEEANSSLANRYGPIVERHANFPNGTNVQFLQILDRGNIRIEIWERGAGYTLSSGSSSCASAAVAYKLGMCGPNIVVHMPGGTIDIEIDASYNVAMTGPVVHICDGEVSDECLA